MIGSSLSELMVRTEAILGTVKPTAYPRDIMLRQLLENQWGIMKALSDAQRERKRPKGN